MNPFIPAAALAVFACSALQAQVRQNPGGTLTIDPASMVSRTPFQNPPSGANWLPPVGSNKDAPAPAAPVSEATAEEMRLKQESVALYKEGRFTAEETPAFMASFERLNHFILAHQ